jgi:hypothetical protein
MDSPLAQSILWSDLAATACLIRLEYGPRGISAGTRTA